MPPTDVILTGVVALFGLAFLGAGLYVASIGVSRIQVARGLRAAGPIPLSEVADSSGLVEFEGTARATDEGTLEGPLSGADCLAYTVSARRRDGDGSSGTGGDGGAGSKGISGPDSDGSDGPSGPTSLEDTDGSGESWQLDGRASASTPFAVEDGAARVAVDPTNAVLSLDDWETTQTPWLAAADLEAGAHDRLDAIGLSELERDATAESSNATATVRQYREQRLEPGGDVHVFGGSVVDSGDSTRPVTVAGDDWFEVSVGDRSSVLPERRRSGSMYVVFGGLIAVPGAGLTIAGIVGLVSTLLL
ncbi:hypothetical protein GS429_18865 [Natronorubrum sp. JWXQ-INN-674]|uniref:Uncharacterized protein n=1 Tax=Natronorubrum halalkaliphilum TaxID=2691917 RepID=A0A6B0VU56_9EURY|nr:hypothetical protein [Natronorubrum halalkaliphilum]MXV64089.1 hypothetical protein [Natronorubrum halalkaliphilum]